MKIMFVEYLLISQVAMINMYIDSIIPRDAKKFKRKRIFILAVPGAKSVVYL